MFRMSVLDSPAVCQPLWSSATEKPYPTIPYGDTNLCQELCCCWQQALSRKAITHTHTHSLTDTHTHTQREAYVKRKLSPLPSNTHTHTVMYMQPQTLSCSPNTHTHTHTRKTHILGGGHVFPVMCRCSGLTGLV